MNTLLLLIVLAQAGVTLVPGTTSTYTDGTYTWAGNPWCAESGLLLQPTSPAIDQGAITDLHCPAAGPSSQFPANADGSPCNEWYGLAPDIGACEYVPSGVQPPPPSGFPVVLDSTLSQPPEEKTVTVNISKPQNAVTVTMRMQGNDAEQCDEGKLYVNGNGPVQLWGGDKTFVPDPAEPCYMTARNGVVATTTIVTDAAWWVDGDNQVKFVHDKVASSGFIIESMTVEVGTGVPPAAPKAPVGFTVK